MLREECVLSCARSEFCLKLLVLFAMSRCVCVFVVTVLRHIQVGWEGAVNEFCFIS